MASSSNLEKTYDVFLSFRGADLRNNFVGHLYEALSRDGIDTFMDSKDLEKGDQISPVLMKAIEESCIAIILFSEDYASSSWCLEEVAKIMECKEQKNLAVLPVFYKVDPREVRTGRNNYAKALAKHESKYLKDPEKMKRWKEALYDAGNLSGWHLNDGDDESKLIQEIVKKISTYLVRTPLQVAKHPVGIDSRVDKLKLMLNLKSGNGVLMVGLWGPGGIGKTSLAKAIYNAMFRQFDGACFLEDVRETSKESKGLVKLQKILLTDILSPQQGLEVSSVSRGINLMQRRLSDKRVLLILDDVDELYQLDALAGERKWFGNGSKIIVTTRDKQLLARHKIDQDHVYEVKALNGNEAHELLSKHVFQMHQIRTDLVDSALNYAKGLPLALVVLGSLLCDTTDDVWESILKKLSRNPSKDISKVLRVSFDGLDKNEKEIFLHIACFFKGYCKEYTMKVLDSCDLEAAAGFDTLIKRSLISIEHGILKVHDLIQAMGIDIVNQQCEDPKGRSRLWLYDDVRNVLQHNEGDCAVKAIVLKPSKVKKLSIHPNAFTKMRRLELLILHNVRNSFQGPICVPNEMRWIELRGCGHWDPHFYSGPKKLVGLDMSNCSITGLVKQFKGFQQLKRLSLVDCIRLVSMPDLSCTPNLEELFLWKCKNLIKVHESIAFHDRLQDLQIHDCLELSVFPNVLKSKTLRNLKICNCPKVERFPDIPCRLEGLKRLLLSGTAIKELPTSIENLCSLKSMFLLCMNLESLPSNIYKLQNIEILEIWDCPNFIGLPKYKDSADGRMMIGLPNLRCLSIRYCNCSKVEFLEDLSCCPSLSELDLEGSGITSLPASISKRDHLYQLELRDCHQLQEIPELPPSLNYFVATGCKSLQTNGRFISIDRFVPRMLTMADTASLREYDEDHDCTFLAPGGEMPEWIQPVEKHTVSFMASRDLYDKFLGLVFYVVFNNENNDESYIDIEGEFNGEGRHGACLMDIESQWNSDHYSLEYLGRSRLWKEVDFGRIDGSYAQFSLTLQDDDDIVKKWGIRIMCKQLKDDLKVEIQDNQLIDVALLYEVGYDSIYSEAKSSRKHEDGPIEIDLLKNFQDCQMNNEEHSQIGSKRNHELILPLGKRIKTMLISNSIDGDENGGVGWLHL